MKEKKYPTSLKPQENKTAAEWYGMILVNVCKSELLIESYSVCNVLWKQDAKKYFVAVFDHPVGVSNFLFS